MADYQKIIDYWFAGDPKKADYKPPGKLWWGSTPEIDEYITTNFGQMLQDADDGKLESWKAEMKSALALIILFDQFSRNIHRGSGKMFATDAKAQVLAKDLIQRKEFLDLAFCEKFFIYLVFEHSEVLETNNMALNGLTQEASLLPESNRGFATAAIQHAKEHNEVIVRFGRYPHRNELLGRQSTGEELEYLKDASGFAKQVQPHKK